MELDFKNNQSDITYKAELIPHLLFIKDFGMVLNTLRRCGINSHIDLCRLSTP